MRHVGDALTVWFGMDERSGRWVPGFWLRVGLQWLSDVDKVVRNDRALEVAEIPLSSIDISTIKGRKMWKKQILGRLELSPLQEPQRPTSFPHTDRPGSPVLANGLSGSPIS